MDKNRSYLSERKYTNNIKLQQNGKSQKYEYWKKILGEKSFAYLLENDSNFNGFIEDKDFSESGDVRPQFFLKNSAKWKLGINTSFYYENSEGKVLFEEFYNGYLQHSIDKLKTNFKEKGEYLTEEAYSDFAIHLAEQLQDICLRTLIAQLHFYKQADKLRGISIEEEYDYFCRKCIGTESFVKHLFAKYPVLYRCIEDKIKQMVHYYTEVINHFIVDRNKIRKYLCGGNPVHKIIGIKGNFSDTHNNGRHVLRIQLNNNMEILYKPRSMENEKVYHQLLDWLSQETKIMQYKYLFISGSDYSWSSLVEYKSCKSQKQLKDYYLRLGVQLFLTYFLGTKDLHCENVIAFGEYPVLIDLELLVNIPGSKERKTVNKEIYHQLSQSVLYTGLLPFYYWNQNGEGINSSAINGLSGQQYPFKVPFIANEKTSEMRVEYHYPVSKNVQNLAKVDGIFYEPYLHRKELLDGFIKAYQQVVYNKSGFRKLLEKLCVVKSRFLAADTQRYSMILSSSYHPSLLMDGAAREVFLYTLWKGRNQQDKKIIKSEVESLLKGDIPYFYYYVNERRLLDSQGEIDKNYFSHTAIGKLYDRLDALGKEDMQKQMEYIELSLNLMPDGKEGYINRVYSVKRNTSTDWNIDTEKKSVLMSRKMTWERQIVELTRRILNNAIWNQSGTEVSWFTVQLSAYGKPNWEVKPMNFYLYDGLSGMLLIMYELNGRQQNEEAKKIYETLRTMLFHYTDAGNKSLAHLNSRSTGAYEGESSVVYAYLLLYQISHEEMYLEYAKKHIQIVEQLLDEDSRYDLLTGNAGAAWVLICLNEVTNEKKYLKLAQRAVNRLKRTAKKQEKGIGWIVQPEMPAMSGMAHGNSGILISVITLWKLTTEDKYAQLAEQIWLYEESLYHSENHNWEDVRARDEKEKDIGTVAWCHGAAGILLSRIRCYEVVEDLVWKERFKKDILRAYRILKEYWRRDSYSLCHGTYGNLWILEIAEQNMLRYGILERNSETGRLDEEWDIEGAVKLLPQERMNPGLLNGYGGILYYLLRRLKSKEGCFDNQ
ncbi:type 2 lanthipeptide synthetase LanM family protein [Faecalicatena contorta]|uniref:Type 2 lantibiotic biosynthesis protein LanM n=1 Tax=Faecalicatena contorta TaxID=39482 RepID=A0A315ZRP6_9FIRM|nr:type 2 lanthipeptide synthetase LanM family protein [Faecalicatena contorta]PWJ47969.1 type 2 lantibiotic biosynthesis protein LanM [Faecalicatena contorta]SUQ15732.1 type 2 lantibiotic biosynthesis protein LanM [Faecalicatena contorta]